MNKFNLHFHVSIHFPLRTGGSVLSIRSIANCSLSAVAFQTVLRPAVSHKESFPFSFSISVPMCQMRAIHQISRELCLLGTIPAARQVQNTFSFRDCSLSRPENPKSFTCTRGLCLRQNHMLNLLNCQLSYLSQCGRFSIINWFSRGTARRMTCSPPFLSSYSHQDFRFWLPEAADVISVDVAFQSDSLQFYSEKDLRQVE